MPPRSTPPPKASVFPPNDLATYRDLLLFEERLKSNAASLQRRKARYQLFLLQLLLVIAFLLSEVLLPPQSSLLAIPYQLALQRLLPEIYTPDVQVTVHPYFSTGLLFVSVTTLVLFFASGMYSEKIAYANKYVPHANRALRSFNMYLNVRKPPLTSKFYFNPLAFFFPRTTPTPTPSQSATPRSRTPSTTTTTTTTITSHRARATSIPIPAIPPATNPRGELIFSSRVDKAFRDAYERYRAAFERRREEREREKASQARWRWWRRLLPGYSASGMGTESRGGSPVVGSAPQLRAAGSSSSSSAGMGTGTVGRRSGSRSRSGTPEGGAGNAGVGGIMMRQRERSGTPPGAASGEGDEMTGSPQRQRTRREGSGDDMRTFALERTLSTHREYART